jgi:CRP-like cAMP-binding protein
MFGEVTFLAGGRATASVVADTPVELYRIEGYYIHILFRLKEGLAGRFYHLISSVLAGSI